MSEELLQTILSEITSMKSEITGLRHEISDIKNEMCNMKTDIGFIKQTMATKEDVEEIPFIKDALMEVSEKVKGMEKDMVKKSDMDFVYHKLMEHDRQIFQLKNR